MTVKYRIPLFFCLALSMLAMACARETPRERQVITFVHVNDLHANYTPGKDGVSPYSRIKGYVNARKKENPFTIFTNAGDDYEKGSIAEVLSAGRATTHITFAMGFDVRLLGNHDFAWSLDELLLSTRDPRAIVLCSNARFMAPEKDRFQARDFAVIEAGKIRVGFFGLLNKPWNEKNEQYNGNYYPDIEMRYDYIARATQIVAEHRDQVDLLVMLSHLGYSNDKKLARAIPGIDAILGGHSHRKLRKPEKVGKTLIVHAGSTARYVARLDLELDLQRKEVVSHRYQLLANNSGLAPPDQELQKLVDSEIERFAPHWHNDIAVVGGGCGTDEIGRITARAAMQMHRADAVIVDLNTISETWRAGPLTQQQLFDTYVVERQPPGSPGFNSFYLVKMRGKDAERLPEALYQHNKQLRYYGPTGVDPEAKIVVALQKHVASNLTSRLLPDIEISTPLFIGEAWQLLSELARYCRDSGLFLDEGSRMPIWSETIDF